ncbi:MAG: TonB family protein [Sandaracinaceae bacterium]|nr:TonB family protein [Sandaracinaceae bacterium]
MTPRSALPPMLVLAIALVASWAIHVPVYVGLGLLSKMLERERPEPPSPPPLELELLAGPEPEPEPPDEARVPEPPEPPAPDRPRAREAPRARLATARPAAPQAQPAAPAPAVEAAPTPPPPSEPPPENLRSVEHRSRDPNVEPPPDAQHLAEENSRVEEEMQARIRNPYRDDPTPQPAPSDEPTAPEEEGDAPETVQAQLRDREGSDARDPTLAELTPQPPTRARPPPTSRTPSVAEAAEGDESRGGSEGSTSPRQAAGGGARARGGGETLETRDVVIDDGNGRFTIRVPVRPEGSGPGEEGGPALAGRGQGNEGAGRASGPAGRSGRTARGGAAQGGGAPNLRLSWTDFATIYGEEELARERELALAQRQSRTRGASRQERWERFRAAIENYDVRVRPGNQTALNTRADPFARYIAAMHRRIHQRFALSFLTRVPDGVDETFRTNSEMHTNLEIGVDAQGRVDHVTVVGTSGNTLFDLGAFEAVMGAQPFPEPPANIRSPDGLVYMHWAFYRNHRQCGTFNARAFILAQAPPRRGGTTPPQPARPPPLPE